MRLFVGVELPGEIKDVLAGFIDADRSRVRNAKWVPRDNLHLTIAFLGDVDEARVAEILDALTAAAMRQPGPIASALDRIGAFPSARRARVLWAGMGDPAGHLAALAEQVASGLEPLGFPREKRVWTPHVTLARLREPGDVGAVLGAPLDAASFTVPAVTLFRSRLARPAPTYEVVARRGLGPA